MALEDNFSDEGGMDRREFLKTSAKLVLLAAIPSAVMSLAGCIGGDEDGDDKKDGQPIVDEVEYVTAYELESNWEDTDGDGDFFDKLRGYQAGDKVYIRDIIDEVRYEPDVDKTFFDFKSLDNLKRTTYFMYGVRGDYRDKFEVGEEVIFEIPIIQNPDYCQDEDVECDYGPAYGDEEGLNKIYKA